MNGTMVELGGGRRDLGDRKGGRKYDTNLSSCFDFCYCVFRCIMEC